ncbi:DUF2291 family protein [Microtetraspora malaysiensis]|uniref:DUF2291 family protein n=1 Tax=Microtetraspora malaysiensis TaxID=161358 RepID=UPI003D94D900
MSPDLKHRPASMKWLVGVVTLAALVVAAALDTKFLSPQQVADLNPPPFSAESYAADKFPKVTAMVKEKAVDLTVLAAAVESDQGAAGKQYGQDLGTGNFAFSVKATGTVEEVADNFILLAVRDVPKDTVVRIAAGPTLSGTPVRDATGTIKFGDFTDQTDYQSVANQFKLQMQQTVLAKLDTSSLKGKQVAVYGAWSTGGPPKSFLVQPVDIEVTP